MMIVRDACINKAGFTWPTGVEKLRFEPFQVNLVGAKWPPTVVEIKLSSGTGPEPIKKSKRKTIPSVKGVVWPESLLVLELLQRSFNTPLEDMVFPDSLQDIVLGGTFNHPVAGIALPSQLRGISFLSCQFNQSIAEIAWPSQLRRIVFLSECFDKPIQGIQWPASLQYPTLGGRINWPIAGIQWPPDLRVLKFSQDFDQ